MWSWGRSFAGIAGSNPAAGRIVSCECCGLLVVMDLRLGPISFYYGEEVEVLDPMKLWELTYNLNYSRCLKISWALSSFLQLFDRASLTMMVKKKAN